MKDETLLTNEAKNIIDNFLEELRIEFNKTTLSENDKNHYINDIQHQIDDLIQFHNEEVITTDIVKQILSKIGEPSDIVSSLDHELGFIDNVGHKRGNYEDNKIIITAKNIIDLYKFTLLINKILLVVLIPYTILMIVDNYNGMFIFLIRIEVLYVLTLIVIIFILYLVNASIINNPYLRLNLHPRSYLVYIPAFLIIFQIIADIKYNLLVGYIVHLAITSFIILYILFYNKHQTLYLRPNNSK